MSPLESALESPATWQARRWSAAAVTGDRTLLAGDAEGDFPVASVTKLLSAWAIHVAVEEGAVGLDDTVGQTGCTLAHLLAHAGGYPFEGDSPVATPGAKRLNTLRWRIPVFSGSPTERCPGRLWWCRAAS